LASTHNTVIRLSSPF